MKKVMTNAWTIAKESAKKFGGNAIEYISGALKQAWKELKSAKESMIGKEVAVAAWLGYKKGLIIPKFGKWFEVDGKKFYTEGMTVVSETEKAVLVDSVLDKIWFPKSQIKTVDYLYNCDDDENFDTVLR